MNCFVRQRRRRYSSSACPWRHFRGDRARLQRSARGESEAQSVIFSTSCGAEARRARAERHQGCGSVLNGLELISCMEMYHEKNLGDRGGCDHSRHSQSRVGVLSPRGGRDGVSCQGRFIGQDPDPKRFQHYPEDADRRSPNRRNRKAEIDSRATRQVEIALVGGSPRGG